MAVPFGRALWHCGAMSQNESERVESEDSQALPHPVPLRVRLFGLALLLAIITYPWVKLGTSAALVMAVVMVPGEIGVQLRVRLYRRYAVSSSDRRYLLERVLKSMALELVALVLVIVTTGSKLGLTSLVLLASIAAVAEWNFTVETLMVCLKYWRPEIFGEGVR